MGHAAYPSYFSAGALPSINAIKFLAAIGVCFLMAADVLLVGIPATSPREIILGYFLWTRVSLSTIAHPSLAKLPSVHDNPDAFTKSGAPIGGKKCIKS